MALALEQARSAAAAGEVPVGAVLVHRGEVLAAAHNRVELLRSPLAHAEMLCLAAASSRLRAWRLLGATLYVTTEPCPMCAGALMQARVGRVVYGARQQRLGADGSWVQLFPVHQPGPPAHKQRQQGQRRRRHHQQQQQPQCQQHQLQQQQAVHGHTEQALCQGAGAGTVGLHAAASGSQRGVAACGCSGAPAPHPGAAASAATTSHGGSAPLHHDRPTPGSAASRPPSPAGPMQAPHGGGAAGAQQTHGSAAAAPRASVHPFHGSLVVEGGCMAAECSELLRAFFRRRRQAAKQAAKGPGGSRSDGSSGGGGRGSGSSGGGGGGGGSEPCEGNAGGLEGAAGAGAACG